MKGLRKLTVSGVIMFSLIFIMTACTNNSQTSTASDQINGQQLENIDNNDQEKTENLRDPLHIPSEDGKKTKTTNEYGTTTKGRGNNIYSSIGTSGIHEGGISSYFESILKAEGVTGVKIFVVDDAVVLARKEQEKTSHEYDNMQNKVLRGDTRGKTGKDEPHKQQEKEKGDDNPTLDNLDKAQEILNNVFNGDIKMLTITDPDAVELVNDIKSDIESSDYEKASDQMTELLKMAD